ncbi:PREDICTED: low molecular weight phosphotyrosine protein phosphatase-like isoform X1 [Eufriesea mexicana]|uniref:low molecular weight phosphotyrosine protein phosphatase-like isoform X1 n=1 Tax=Eufriesea mexicana TaxID=516756 RepID=UPI00083BB0F7|nr:PREDICTED: low molecular weight phosphotyrosine protein phosphatase-like isoform X1 [Eufriesea mexicana]
MNEKKRVLMICLGNICRSPIAEAVFQDQINKLKLADRWEVRSAALVQYHLHKPPDSRTLSVLRDNGIINYIHKVKQIDQQDFYKYDYIFGMDNENIKSLNRLKPNDCKAKIELLGKYDPQQEIIIRDPYYVEFYDMNIEGFKKVYEQCVRSIVAFLEQHKT